MNQFHFFLLTLFLLSPFTSRGADEKPVFLYCTYFSTPGENRYSPDGNMKPALDLLKPQFTVAVSNNPLTAENLKAVSVLLIPNPGDKAVPGNPPPRHMNAQDIRELKKFVANGGGLIVSGNQENHNLEINDMNTLLSQWGIQFTNAYTDAKKLTLPQQTPIIGGLRWAYYTGNALLLDLSNPAKPTPLVTNDLAQKPEKGPRDHPGILMATANPGKGHVLVTTDTGWFCDWAFNETGVGGVSLKGQDNQEIFTRLVKWTAGIK
jgi:hypothetical protein